MSPSSPSAFTYNGGAVEPGESANFRFTVSETYLGDPVRIPVTIINGSSDGPTACLTAASHGDELNGVEVVRTVAQQWSADDLNGTVVCLPVLNVPGFLAQERYLPIIDRDLNRAFRGSETGTSAQRIAYQIYENFIAPTDFVIDFHTSTRGRNNMLHVLADLSEPSVDRLARAFGSNVIIDGEGPSGSLRREATTAGIPTISVEMGQAHRFQRSMIDAARNGIESVMAEFGLRHPVAVHWPSWRTVIDPDRQNTWIRADAGGIVDMHFTSGDLVYEGETICTISNPFVTEKVDMEAPFTGLLVGVLENPVVYPGNPLCRIVELDDVTRRIIESNTLNEAM